MQEATVNPNLSPCLRVDGRPSHVTVNPNLSPRVAFSIVFHSLRVDGRPSHVKMPIYKQKRSKKCKCGRRLTGVSKTRGRGRGRGPLFFCFVFCCLALTKT